MYNKVILTVIATLSILGISISLPSYVNAMSIVSERSALPCLPTTYGCLPCDDILTDVPCYPNDCPPYRPFCDIFGGGIVFKDTRNMISTHEFAPFGKFVPSNLGALPKTIPIAVEINDTRSGTVQEFNATSLTQLHLEIASQYAQTKDPVTKNALVDVLQVAESMPFSINPMIIDDETSSPSIAEAKAEDNDSVDFKIFIKTSVDTDGTGKIEAGIEITF
ncbi:MAG: hypothetical protein L0H53_14500 [Candidatus Nitrosocosmicus sp.]|nr:hypothetical protein [Candidatus Nitrosocosmicus sp.]MDN5868570.1 hypothetical protein [Candidatus Nitrosocosmicus sp.]